MLKTEEEVSNSYDYGLALIKILMCFEVVLCHYWVPENEPFYLKPFQWMRMNAVTLFMIMSFYFCKKLYLEGKTVKFKRRMWRLIFPYVVWAIVYFVIYETIQLIFGVNLSVSISDLGWQLLLGSSPVLNPPFWYQADLIIITALYFVIFKFLSKEKSLIVIWILTAVSIFLQYSGINQLIFEGFEYEVRYTTGRLAEMIPFATIGISLAITSQINRIKEHRVLAIAILTVLYCLIFKYQIPEGTAPGFGYGGAQLIISSVIIFLLVIVIPFDKMFFFLKIAVQRLGKYTFGIFCLHFGVGNWINKFYSCMGWEINTFFECILIFILCYCVCALINLIPNKYFRQLVE